MSVVKGISCATHLTNDFALEERKNIFHMEFENCNHGEENSMLQSAVVIQPCREKSSFKPVLWAPDLGWAMLPGHHKCPHLADSLFGKCGTAPSGDRAPILPDLL